MKIKNYPRFYDTKKVEKLYSEKDKVPVKYVATTCLDGSSEEGVKDIYYRETPHPKFENRYFGIYRTMGGINICSADKIEELEFGMIPIEGKWEYSSHRHDYKSVDGRTIDGGRAYVRGNGMTMFHMKDGEFVEDVDK